MDAQEFESWLADRTEQDWNQIAAAAREAGVGSWRWDQAWESIDPLEPGWMAAAAIDAIARAAAVGALAALRADGSLDSESAELLLAPFVRNLEPAVCV